MQARDEAECRGRVTEQQGVQENPRPGIQAPPVLVSWKKPRSWRRREEKSCSRIRKLILDMVKVKVPPLQPADSELQGREEKGAWMGERYRGGGNE